MVVFLHATGKGVFSVPIFVAEAGNFDTFSRSRCVNEIVVADVKADVGNTAGTHGAEKDHVAPAAIPNGSRQRPFAPVRQRCAAGLRPWRV